MVKKETKVKIKAVCDKPECLITAITQSKKYEESIIRCPKCNVNMNKLTDGKIVIDKCPKCEGIFLDKHEVETTNKLGIFYHLKTILKSKLKVRK
ncbi:MAG: zf-TFIIB domain-containing protein [Nanoarchaeota archaeon]